MVKQLTFILLLSVITQISAQETLIIISGKINSDALSVKNIHILNKNSKKGTISNKYGEFSIPIKVNDTLVFSGIQFYKKEIQITSQLIKHKLITIELFQKINELDEVEIKAHNLSGNLVTDANNIKKPVSKVGKGALDFSMIDFSKPLANEVDAIHIKNPTDVRQMTNPNIPVTGNILGLLKFALDPLMGEISKIGQRKRHLKHEKYKYEKKTVETPNNIIDYLGESFFIETLKIPSAEIDEFLEYCKSKGIVDLYIKNPLCIMI